MLCKHPTTAQSTLTPSFAVRWNNFKVYLGSWHTTSHAGFMQRRESKTRGVDHCSVLQQQFYTLQTPSSARITQGSAAINVPCINLWGNNTSFTGWESWAQCPGLQETETELNLSYYIFIFTSSSSITAHCSYSPDCTLLVFLFQHQLYRHI